MISFSEAIAQCAEHIAEHDAHGYSQPNRKGHGVEELSFSDGTPYSIHWGDYDCSEMARTCAEAAGLVSKDVWMWTGNEHIILTEAGFYVVDLGDAGRGDILWKTGHTGICLGDGMMADAHGDEYGGIDGPNEGDQTGREIEIRPMWSCSWQKCYRAPEGYIGVENTSISNGIDISNHQGSDGASHIRDTSCGFAIVKASEGDWFTDKYAADNARAAADSGKLYGFYHFAGTAHAEAEAEFFVERCNGTGLLDWATLWLDYEAEAVGNGPAWAECFMKRVDELTGKTCGIYMSQAVTVSQDWTMSAKRPLWVAQYATDEPVHGWQDHPWSTEVFGAWSECAIHQYTEKGFVDGHGPLDLDRGYFTAEQWASWAGGASPAPTPEPHHDEEYDEMTPRTVTFRTAVNVRSKPTLCADIVTVYTEGESVTVDGLAIAEGYVWGHYIGSKSGEDRWVALGETDFVSM